MIDVNKKIKNLEYISKNLIGSVEELEDIHIKLDELYNMKDEKRR